MADANFPTILKSVRGQLGLSQAELAGRLRSTQRHVSFLETGRSQPSRTMLGRLCTELDLSAAQRSALFAASGLQNPYKQRDLSSAEVIETLDMLEARALKHWPFPAFVLADDWTVLRANTAGHRMFAPFNTDSNAPMNLLALFLSEQFFSMVQNWEDASASFYFRLLAHADDNEHIGQAFADARGAGLFDHVAHSLTDRQEAPVYVPLELSLPNGATLRMTSLLAQLASVHDALVEGFDIEFMIPVDESSEAILMQMAP